MRAAGSIDGLTRHLSGAERLIEEAQVPTAVSEMLARAAAKHPESFNIAAEAVPDGACQHVQALPVQTVQCSSPPSAVEFAVELLSRAGVSRVVAANALSQLKIGLGPDGSAMRGASLWDSRTGQRLESDQQRGVRTVRFDYTADGAASVRAAMAAQGIASFRAREALAVATKTLWSGVSAELCWSDEPGYTTGYVASPRDGYVRLPEFKDEGLGGGRIFFIDTNTVDVDVVVNRLENSYVLIDPPIVINDSISPEQFLINS